MKTVSILLLMISLPLYSQNIIYRGSNKYSATEEWKFETPDKFIDELSVQVGRTDKGGLLRLSIDSDFDNYIAGNVYVFLEDGTMLTCTDKKIKDKVDGKSVVLYYFTNSEMEKLAELDIMKIRFTLKSSQFGTENYTAENAGKSTLKYIDENLKMVYEYYDTSSAILTLFSN